MSHEFETHGLRVNIFICGEFYNLEFKSLLRVNVFTCKEVYCPLLSNLDEAILLIALLIIAIQNLINNSKTERFFHKSFYQLILFQCIHTVYEHTHSEEH